MWKTEGETNSCIEPENMFLYQAVSSKARILVQVCFTLEVTNWLIS